MLMSYLEEQSNNIIFPILLTHQEDRMGVDEKDRKYMIFLYERINHI